MAHFVKLDDNNIVTEGIVVSNDVLLDENGNESEALGIAFCERLLGGRWIQTSYNRKLRKNYAGQGYLYDPIRDAFIPPKPFESWILDEETCTWFPPIPYPTDGKKYFWNENLGEWQDA